MRCIVLRKLLEWVAEGGVHSQAELAQRLGVSEELLAQMLEELARMGYLRPVGAGCQEHCDGCPLTVRCAVGGPGRIWTLTEKGGRAGIATEVSNG